MLDRDTATLFVGLGMDKGADPPDPQEMPADAAGSMKRFDVTYKVSCRIGTCDTQVLMTVAWQAGMLRPALPSGALTAHAIESNAADAMLQTTASLDVKYLCAHRQDPRRARTSSVRGAESSSILHAQQQ